MRTEIHGDIVLTDLELPAEDFAAEFIGGLRQQPKRVPCKFFYDERGSQLFDQICELEEYYPTRVEMKILRERMVEIADLCGPRCVLVEPGSGSSGKTRLLLDHLEHPMAYMPIDISRRHLIRAAETLNGDYFGLEILPVCADYSRPLRLPVPSGTANRTIIFFPGSTIGNFEPWQARAFLRRLASWCQPGDGLLIGVDLRKDHEVLMRAYNDARGITAAFNLNLLHRANRQLGADFVVHQFRHEAVYDDQHGRIEMRLVSQCPQRVRIAREPIEFNAEERITTEYSYKYSLNGFRELASRAGWVPERAWTDDCRWFSVHYLTLPG